MHSLHYKTRFLNILLNVPFCKHLPRPHAHTHTYPLLPCHRDNAHIHTYRYKLTPTHKHASFFAQNSPPLVLPALSLRTFRQPPPRCCLVLQACRCSRSACRARVRASLQQQQQQQRRHLRQTPRPQPVPVVRQSAARRRAVGIGIFFFFGVDPFFITLCITQSAARRCS